MSVKVQTSCVLDAHSCQLAESRKPSDTFPEIFVRLRNLEKVDLEPYPVHHAHDVQDSPAIVSVIAIVCSKAVNRIQ